MKERERDFAEPGSAGPPPPPRAPAAGAEFFVTGGVHQAPALTLPDLSPDPFARFSPDFRPIFARTFEMPNVKFPFVDQEGN